MKPAPLILAALVAVLIAVPSPAAPCQTAVCQTPAYVAPVVTPLALALPLYGAGYVGASSGDDETKELLRALLAEIKAMRTDLANLPTGGGDVVPPLRAGTPKVDVFAVFKASCASCHTSKVAESLGGGFEMITDDGKFIRLPPSTRKELVKRVKAGTMPPPSKDRAPLSQPVRQAIEAAMTDVATIPAAKK